MDNEQSQDSATLKKSLIRLTGLIVLAMLIPVVPFLLGGEYLEGSIEKWIQSDFSQPFRLTATLLVLMADIFLPVPSSAVITYCGATCGIVPATVAAWAGLTTGGVIGYELSRLWGSRLINRLSGQEDRHQMHGLVSQYGSLVIILTRPLPILGETAVLIVGSLFMQRFAFYRSLLLSNLAISLVYASFGSIFSAPELLPWVLAASLIIPLILTFAVRLILSHRNNPPQS